MYYPISVNLNTETIDLLSLRISNSNHILPFFCTIILIDYLVLELIIWYIYLFKSIITNILGYKVNSIYGNGFYKISKTKH